MPLPKRLLVWTIFVVMATGQSLQAANPPVKSKASSIAKPTSKPKASSAARPGATASSQSESSARKLIVKKHPLPTGLYDISIFYEGSSEPIATVRDKKSERTEKINQQDTPMVIELILAHVLNMTGLEKRIEGEYLKSASLYRLALQHAEKAGNSTILVDCLINLAGIYLRMDRAAESEALYRRCLTIVQKEDPESTEEQALIIDNLAQAFLAQKKYSEAERCSRRSLELYQSLNPKQPVDIAKCLSNFAAIQTAQHKYVEAQANIIQAIKLMEPTGEQKYLAILYDNLAQNYGLQGRLTDAIKGHQKALTLFKQSYGPTHPETAVCLVSIAHTYLDLKDWKNAAAYLKPAQEIFANTEGPTSKMATQLQFEYQECLQKIK